MTHEHLSDEQLSAYLDGEQGDDAGEDPPSDRTVEVGIVGCDTCRHRLAALTGARALVRQPVAPVSSSVRSAAVESAVAEGLGPLTAAGPGTGTETGTVRQLRRPSRSSPLLLGAAAAVALVVVGVSLGLSHIHNGGSVTSSASPAVTHPPPQRSSAAAPAASGVGIPDLGSITSSSALRARVGAGLTPSTHKQAVGNGSAFESQPAAPTSAGAPAASDNVKGGSSTSLGTAVSVPASLQTCVSAAERSAGTTAVLQWVATATYEHTPALVVVVHTTAPSSTTALSTTAGSTAVSTTAVVVARTGCRVLARTTI
jgi:hypothetical protein